MTLLTARRPHSSFKWHRPSEFVQIRGRRSLWYRHQPSLAAFVFFSKASSTSFHRRVMELRVGIYGSEACEFNGMASATRRWAKAVFPRMEATKLVLLHSPILALATNSNFVNFFIERKKNGHGGCLEKFLPKCSSCFHLVPCGGASHLGDLRTLD